jgi:hypothetical protein
MADGPSLPVSTILFGSSKESAESAEAVQKAMFNSLCGSGPEAQIGSIPAELGSIDERIAKLCGIAAERKDHEAVWKKRGRLIESLS